MSQSLWRAWSDVAGQLTQADDILLFLDYDGTLVPIAEHPSKARLSAPVRRLLARLATRPGVWVALVSGRAVDELKAAVGVETVHYVGNHGLEVTGPQLHYVNPIAEASRARLAQLLLALREAVRGIDGAWIEDKGLTLTIHYRLVSPAEAIIVKERVLDVLRPAQACRQIFLTTGKCVLEVRPPVQWTKGTMVSWLLARRAALTEAAQTLPVYIGDDATDEDAFRALRSRGVTVLVGGPREPSSACYQVASPVGVHQFLSRLDRLREAKGAAS